MLLRSAPPLLTAIATLVCASAWANAPTTAPSAVPKDLKGAAPCVEGAAAYHGVNPWILKAILKVESDFDPKAYNRNANGTVDVGMAQINSIHFAKLGKFGIKPEQLLDGCVATYVAAWHLAGQIRTHGNTWFGVASYHSASRCQNDRYAGLLWNALVSWGAVPGPRVRVQTLAQCGYFPPGNSPVRRAAQAGSPTSSVVAFDAN